MNEDKSTIPPKQATEFTKPLKPKGFPKQEELLRHFWRSMVEQSRKYPNRELMERVLEARKDSAGKWWKNRMRIGTKKLEKIAYYDGLTGMPNREKFLKDLNSAIIDCRNRETQGKINEPLHLLFLDVDDFKPVNDTLGHANGDAILRLMPHLVKDLPSRTEEPIYRIGGDEFVQIVRGVKSQDEMAPIVKRYNENMREMSEILLEEATPKGQEAPKRVQLSIGIAQYHGQKADELISEADGALYEAKYEGKGRAYIAVFNNGQVSYQELNQSLEEHQRVG